MSETIQLTPARAGVDAGRWLRGVLVGAVGIVVALVGTGCVATVGPEPVYVASTGGYVYSDGDVAYVDTVPADIYASPTVVYGGTNVYWVNGHWYYPYGGRWAYYRHEPPMLYRQRTAWVGTPGYYGRYYGTSHRGHYHPGYVYRGSSVGYHAPARPAPRYQAPARPTPRYQAPARPTPRYQAPAARTPSRPSPATRAPVYRSAPVKARPQR
ncbi:hypothetical protein [Chondromyces crocatus]|uniref:Uncharacterized protein n=1 Tax=Chondromyces crocatus TaxID=52 RepID=A0A0K1EQL9_CHOCO|nr:hypothetical protein [Chondromyces crocatus]AKT43131.1 uncharacterized protein CMC5_073590 [Chondromyces crocatus]